MSHPNFSLVWGFDQGVFFLLLRMSFSIYFGCFFSFILGSAKSDLHWSDEAIFTFTKWMKLDNFSFIHLK